MRKFLDVHCWLFSVKVTSRYFYARIYGYSVFCEFHVTFCNKGIENVYQH